jgi:ribose 5-phosphate isomerase B
MGYEVVDKGAFKFDEGDDYPDYIIPVAKEISEMATQNDTSKILGIILGGSGQGEAMCANRFPNVRAVVFYGGPIEIIKLSREHNDANILSIGARFVSEDEAKEAVKVWLETAFSGDERHIRRIKKIEPNNL